MARSLLSNLSITFPEIIFLPICSIQLFQSMEQYQSNLDDDLRPAKRPRITTRESTRAQVKYPIAAGYRIGTYTASGRTLTLADQLRIYDIWQGECHRYILIAFLAALNVIDCHVGQGCHVDHVCHVEI